MKYRYTLRNQEKIAARLGDDYLKLLVDSLNSYFKNREKVPDEYGEEGVDRDAGRTYLMIPSVAKNSEIDFQFVLLRRIYNVYHLAYYSAVG